MLDIQIKYDADSRKISLISQHYSGATIDNVSAMITLTDLPLGYNARLDFKVQARDTDGKTYYPYLELDAEGKVIIPNAILSACKRDLKLPLQLVLTKGNEVIASRNVLTLEVAFSIDATGSATDAYSPTILSAFIDVDLDETGELSFEQLNKEKVSVNIIDVLTGNGAGKIPLLHEVIGDGELITFTNGGFYGTDVYSGQYHLMGSVPTIGDLPIPNKGEGWIVEDKGLIYEGNGSEWELKGKVIELQWLHEDIDELRIADNELRDDLDSEVTERIAGQSSLQGQININNTEIGNLQSSKEDRINRGATDGYAPLNNLRKIIMDYIITGTSAGTLPLLVAQVLDGEVLYYDAPSGGIRSKTLENPIVVKGEVQTVANLPATSTPGFTYRTIEPGMHEGQIVYWWTYSDSGVWLPSPFYIDVSVYQLVSNLVNELIRSGDNANVDTSHYTSTLCVSNIVDTLNNTIAGKASQTDLDMLSDTLSYLTDEVDVISNDVAVLQNKYAHHLSFMDTGTNGHYITTTIINDNPTPFADAQTAINYLRNYCGTTTTSQILASGSYYQTTTSTRVTVSALRGGTDNAIFVLGFNAAGSYAGNNFTGANFTNFNDRVIRI